MRGPAPSRRGVAWHGALAAVLGALALLPRQAVASPALRTFGPGKVSCQPLAGTHMDCLLSATLIRHGTNVVSFDVSVLPRRDQALFRKWCLAGTDACTVTLTGRSFSPQATRLATVTSVHWTRLSEPASDAVARAGATASSADPR